MGGNCQEGIRTNFEKINGCRAHHGDTAGYQGEFCLTYGKHVI